MQAKTALLDGDPMRKKPNGPSCPKYSTQLSTVSKRVPMNIHNCKVYNNLVCYKCTTRLTLSVLGECDHIASGTMALFPSGGLLGEAGAWAPHPTRAAWVLALIGIVWKT